ncbi:unnamed protein product [Rhizophagus irregularis]|nr:unnamed protein product [Rhizophagus irregularis]CAB4436543.1 unnamed protein product [Rhizophagus irregularis]
MIKYIVSLKNNEAEGVSLTDQNIDENIEVVDEVINNSLKNNEVEGVSLTDQNNDENNEVVDEVINYT